MTDRRTYMREYMREYREAHPDYNPRTREAQNMYMRVLKDVAIESIGGYICCQCGCTDRRILEINHIEGGGRKENLNNRRKRFFNDIINNENRCEKYNILCRVCNAQHYVEQILGIKGHTVSWSTPT
jgi:hypothetical protein